MISVGKIFLTGEGGDLLLQVARTGQHGPTTQLVVDLREVEQVVVVHVHLIHQYLELSVLKAMGEDGVDDFHHDRYDINDASRIGAHGLLVHDAVHLVAECVRRPHSRALAAKRPPSSPQSSPRHHRSSRTQDGRGPGSAAPHTEARHRICLAKW